MRRQRVVFRVSCARTEVGGRRRGRTCMPASASARRRRPSASSVAARGQPGVTPACEQVLEVPVALAMAQENEHSVHLETVLLSAGTPVYQAPRARAHPPSCTGQACARAAHIAALSAPRAKMARSSALWAQLDPLARRLQRSRCDRRRPCRRAATAKPIRLGFPRAGDAVAAAYGGLLRQRSRSRPSAAASPSSRAVPDGASTFRRWCISKISMSKLGAESPAAAWLHQRGEQVDAEAHVARALTMVGVARRRLDLGEVVRREAGGADHVDDARLRGEGSQRDAGLGRREVDDAVGLDDERRGRRR